ncbi:putative transmembrane protein precursor [Bradyrhizobium oligotrophicum S58]|uniref:Putative transmembrane protein n=1 Tax=Bradyrhizobium oligotrophicum S58 TaxID=1245469 RepID=M4ZEW2_9BRAD|nr:DoxX family protein [Bradyrhizobium oligotrophicum]BAM92353.1 putative transmembrane protein precursor [Bradyrhizobium oligotrophicum S58]
MVHAVSIWLLAAAFFGAGLLNAVGTAGTRSDFARWGYPRWWGKLTGGLEIVTAALIALPAARSVGLTLAAAIIAAAVVTVLRHRDVLHLVPLGAFIVLIGVAAMP